VTTATFRTIIWATDGSNVADHAMPFARDLAKTDGAKLITVHVDELIAGKALSGPLHGDEHDVQAQVRANVQRLRDEGIDAELVVTAVGVGGAAHAIADIARDRGADVIVAGTRGQSALRGLIVGSVTHRLLHIAPCAVLAVPPPGSAPAAEPIPTTDPDQG